MRCEHTTNVTVAPRGYGSRTTNRSVRCRRKARVLAEIPYGENTVDYRYCHEDARKRSADVRYSRGKVVSITALPEDPNEYVAPRDAHGKFCRRGAG